MEKPIFEITIEGCSYEIEEYENIVYIGDNLFLDELIMIINHYRNKGYNYVYYGHENSTLCLGKRSLEDEIKMQNLKNNLKMKK